MKYLCEEQSLAFDLPVVKNGVTYKNVFCIICNTEIDIENDDILVEKYNVMDFYVICNNPFNFMYKRNLHKILQSAEEQNCGVILNTRDAVRCEEYRSKRISTCQNKATPQSLRWACENLSKHSLPPVNQYKNEFCKLCNGMVHYKKNETSVEDPNYTECNRSNELHVQYEEACLLLPNVAYHPDVFPHRNVFCSYCAHGDQHIEHVPSHSCKPTHGSDVLFMNRLIRDLFYPSMTFRSNIRDRPEEVIIKVFFKT
jgi:hypothetical protein